MGLICAFARDSAMVRAAAGMKQSSAQAGTAWRDVDLYLAWWACIDGQPRKHLLPDGAKCWSASALPLFVSLLLESLLLVGPRVGHLSDSLNCYEWAVQVCQWIQIPPSSPLEPTLQAHR